MAKCHGAFIIRSLEIKIRTGRFENRNETKNVDKSLGSLNGTVRLRLRGVGEYVFFFGVHSSQ